MEDKIQKPVQADAKALRGAIAKVQARSKSARLREVMPEIDEKLRSGARAADIVAALADAGLDVTPGTLWKCRSRWRAQAGKSEARGRAMAPEAVPRATPALGATDGAGTEDSTDVIVSDASDDRSLEAMLDPKRGEKFAEQFMKRPPARWFRDKGSKDE